MSSSRKIGVLLGGLSVERDTSMRAGEAVTAALRHMGHEAFPMFVDRDIDVALRQTKIDVAFLAVRGRYSADGCLQGLLEIHGIPYTGSGVLASGLATNRAKSKDVLRLCNLPIAPGYVLRSDHAGNASEIHGAFGYPVVVRPMSASLLWGGTLARDELELEGALDDVRGQEPSAPVRLSRERQGSVLRLATQAYEALGCEGPACVEMLVSERLNETIVDIDTSPVLLPTSPLPLIAKHAGIAYGDLVEDILAGARLRAHGRRANRRAVQAMFEGPDRRQSAVHEAH
jgi:D-alanine-D-alanine ligase